ncbi:diguanylate cyclase [Leptothoe kymatousa]|uniref:GGDEF domain-containing protein n=1 Tax=Leptothoe kymatousa TAU-MAC 1615 TaxID=2364775 RepID=A0ABS5Y6C0_9CYAN|nr:diguanylate cyclase [Leptothoe kymatousa]MBT9313373.1 GGDEF domain-containing protein [Leptothoe kymatousa TAU-MAC 1615]
MSYCPDSEESLACVLQQQLQRHINLRNVIRRIHRSLAIDELQHTIVNDFLQFFQADWVFLLEKKHGRWQPIYRPACLSEPDHLDALSDYLALEQVNAKLSHCDGMTVPNQAFHHNGEQQCPPDLAGSWLLMPMHLPRASGQNSSPCRLVAIGSKRRAHLWTVEHQEQASLLVDEVGVALDHSRHYEALKLHNRELKSLALTDSLTGLANRRQFDTYFKTEWQRLARENQPLTLILCDIDYFKLYNDYYGHPTGDVCLTQVSQVLARCIRRPADLVTRYGGEEFAVVLPNTDTSGGHNVALTIQEQLAKAAIPHETSEVSENITLTMGIATVIPKHHLCPQDLLQAADLALYHAKQQGRDRIYVHAHYYLHSDEASPENSQLNGQKLDANQGLDS